MAIVYVEPGDLTTAQQGQVLEFLNQITTAEELAERIEFPGELDIGIKLAQRLLKARSDAGGAFSALVQVASVAFIGPERFTEICAAALGLNPARWNNSLDLSPHPKHPFTEDYDRLQKQLDALLGLSEPVVLDLQCTTQAVWLGQDIDLRLYARDLTGRPLANRRITVEAGTGTLEVAYGLVIQSGQAVEVRTGVDGSVRLSLHYAPPEPLTLDQQAALEDVLKRLDPTANTPHALKDVFHQIAAMYQQEGYSSLREALDIYACEGKSRFFDQINASNLGFYWPMEVSVLRADYHPHETGAACTAKAVTTVRWKNWVGAWFEFLGDYLSGKAGLTKAFAKAKHRGSEGFRLVDDLIGEAHSFVAGQQGLAAQWLSQRVVKHAVNDFLATEIDAMDASTQRNLFSHLDIASEQLTPTHRGTLSTMKENRLELNTKIDQISRINTDLLVQMSTIHQDILASVTAVQMAKQSIEAAQIAIDEKTSHFNIKYAEVLGDISAAHIELADFRRQRTEITLALNTVKEDMAKVELDISHMKRIPGEG